MELFWVASIILVFTLPFGYWRANVRVRSFQWFLAIHLPVPFLVVLRLYAGVGLGFVTFPVLAGSFFSGQYVGGRIRQWRLNRESTPLTSCLVWDLVKACRKRESS